MLLKGHSWLSGTVKIISHTYLILNKEVRFERVISASGSAIIVVVPPNMFHRTFIGKDLQSIQNLVERWCLQL